MSRFKEDDNNVSINFDLLLSYLNDAYRLLYAAYQDIVVEKKTNPYRKRPATKTWHIENVITEDLVDLAEEKSIQEGLNFEWDDQNKTTNKKFVDISITYQLGLGRNKRLRIECKHFKNTSSDILYVKEGIQRFQTGYYASQMSIGGMLGYVESGEVEDRVERINNKMSYSKLTTFKFKSKLPNTYLSKHDRTFEPNSIDSFRLYHMFLDFRGLIERE